MAFSVTGDAAFTVDQGDEYTIVVADITITDGDADDVLSLDVVPTYGSLLLDGVVLEADDTWLVSDIVAGSLVYRNDGQQDDADTFDVVAIPMSGGTPGTPTAATSVTVTVTANTGWLAILTPTGKPPRPVVWHTQKWFIETYINEWLSNHWGSVEYVASGADDVITFDWLTLDDDSFLSSLAQDQENAINAEKVSEMTSRLLIRLEETDMSTVKTAVSTSGSGIWSNRVAFHALSAANKARLNELFNDINISGNINDWLAALDAADAAIG